MVESYRILSPLAGHPITYGKFVMDKYIKEEITPKIFIHGSPSIRISYVSKTKILNKEELVLEKEREILSPKSQDCLSYNQREILV